MTTFSIKTHTTIDTNFNARKYSFEFEEENEFESAEGKIIKKTTQTLRDENGNVIQKSFNTSKKRQNKSFSFLKAKIPQFPNGLSSLM